MEKTGIEIWQQVVVSSIQEITQMAGILRKFPSLFLSFFLGFLSWLSFSLSWLSVLLLLVFLTEQIPQ